MAWTVYKRTNGRVFLSPYEAADYTMQWVNEVFAFGDGVQFYLDLPKRQTRNRKRM